MVFNGFISVVNAQCGHTGTSTWVTYGNATTGDQKSTYQYNDPWLGFQETTTRNRINQNAVMLYLPIYLHLNITF